MLFVGYEKLLVGRPCFFPFSHLLRSLDKGTIPLKSGSDSLMSSSLYVFWLFADIDTNLTKRKVENSNMNPPRNALPI